MRLPHSLFCCLLSACSIFIGTSAVAQPDISTFTDFAEFEDIKISPQGTYLAFTQHEDNREYLTVIRADDLSGVSRTSFGSDTDVTSFDWVNDERILFSPGRAFMGQLDYKQPTGEIFGIDADGKNFEMLFGFQAGQQGTGRIKARESIRAAGRIVDLLPDDPEHVIVQSVGYGIEGEMNNEAWRMDVRTGNLRSLATSPIRNGMLVTDADHEIRFAFGTNNQNIGELYQRDDKGAWSLLVTDEDKERWARPTFPWGDDGRMLVADLGPGGTQGYSIWDPATGAKEELFHHPDVDVQAAFFDNKRQLWAIQYLDHFPAFFYPDESHPFVALHRRLVAGLKDRTPQIVDETDAMDKLIVYISSPTHPGDFALMTAADGAFHMRLARYPAVQPELLGRMDPIEFQVRDGTAVRGYLTMPPGKPEKNLPMVVVPHGGPHGVYDSWSYNAEVQLLASRGYAVLQVNFRGSGGRGEPFMEAGHGEWGGKMQDDLTDAVHWAIADGVADPQRICIFGGSYGAYAALTGAYKEPDLFKCAIGLSGIYDLNLMFTEGDIADAQRGISYLKEVLGEDSAQLASRSPVANAHKITANVMLVHGQKDVRAPLEHAERMREALQKAGKEPLWLTESGETHGIMSEENRIKVYQALLDFLDANIGH
jgi:dipeptidyl aminopeptidase/acylaminoacyl peptidase